MQNQSNLMSSSSHRRLTANPLLNASNNSNTRELCKPLSLMECCSDGSPPPQLQINDKVVWISDNGPEFGCVKWLGKLPDVGTDWMAGVDFVNAVGSGTGLYNDHQLFETRMNHASLVPVIGLMKAQDYLGSTHPSIGQVITSFNDNLPQKPRRIKTSKVKDENKNEDNKRMQLSSNKLLASDSNAIDSHKLSLNSSNINNANSISINHNINHNNNNILTKAKPINSLLTANPITVNTATSMTNANTSSASSASPNSVINNNNNNSPQPHTHPYPNSNSNSSAVPLGETLASNSSHINEKPKSNELTTNALNTNSIDCTQINGSVSAHDFEIGSVVEIIVDSIPRYGVVRWIGSLSDQKSDEPYNLMTGIEMEEESVGFSDGSYQGKRYFECAPRKAHFVKLNQCTKDSRFTSMTDRCRSALFGSIDCPTVSGDVPPLSTPEDLQALCGKNRGIQGHHNSCYLDATLFSMFSCTTIFESLLHRPPRIDDIPEYCEVQRVLKEEIVNPLRENLYVRADRVMHLRTLLEKISSVRGLTSEEKDPEEFLNLLLNEILKAEPYLKLSSGLESFFYQLFVEKDEKLHLPTVQQLFDQSFLASDIKLREVPPCLLIQMPRFGRQFKMYPRITPSLYLDITDVLENSPRQCAICGQVAEFECKECFGQFGEGLDSIAFCAKCMDKSHGHKKRCKHKTTKLSIPPEFNILKDHTHIPRIYMELFAVLCIETSHYVSFVKCGSGPDSPWCFFDSMADRKGEQNGYNIPEVVSFPDLRWWLSDEGTSFLLSTKDDKMLPEMPRRLLCDAYICWYASDVLRYR